MIHKKHSPSLLALGVFALSLAASRSSQAIEASLPMGQGLYEQQGANSCLYCHGEKGQGGKVAAAANLTKPKNWKSYKGLGGDAAFKKNPTEFKKNLEEATVNLIIKGAIGHNVGYKKPYFDWKQTGGTFNSQMLGLGGAPSAAWLNKYKDRGVTKEIAAKAAYMWVQTFDTQNVFK